MLSKIYLQVPQGSNEHLQYHKTMPTISKCSRKKVEEEGKNKTEGYYWWHTVWRLELSGLVGIERRQMGDGKQKHIRWKSEWELGT